MSTADLIAEARRAADKKRADLALESASLFTRLADALEDAVAATSKDPQRVVSTVAKLDALPVGSVVRCDDAEGIGMNIAERREFGWVHVGADFEFTSAQMVDGGLSYTVLWVGGTE